MASKARTGSVISVSQASDPDLEEAELTDQEASDWSGIPGYWDASSQIRKSPAETDKIGLNIQRICI